MEMNKERCDYMVHGDTLEELKSSSHVSNLTWKAIVPEAEMDEMVDQSAKVQGTLRALEINKSGDSFLRIGAETGVMSFKFKRRETCRNCEGRVKRRQHSTNSEMPVLPPHLC